MDELKTPSLKFSVPLVRTVMAVLGTIIAGTGLALFVGAIYELFAGQSATTWAPILGLVVLGIFGAFVLLRVGLLAAVEVSETEVTIRGTLRSKRVPLVDIAEVEVAAGSSLTLPWKVPALRLRDGRMMKVENLRVLGRVNGTPVEAFMIDVHDRISFVHR